VKHWFLQEPHCVTSQKKALFIVTAMKTSNLIYVINIIKLVLSKFRVSLFATDHLLIRDTTLFDNIQKSNKFLLVSSTNIIGAARVFIVGGRSFV
jgi:hypothetical protein